jgi:hypothetical protein
MRVYAEICLVLYALSHDGCAISDNDTDTVSGLASTHQKILFILAMTIMMQRFTTISDLLFSLKRSLYNPL